MKIFGNLFLSLLLLTFFSLSVEAKKISKKNSQYTGKEIVEYETMTNAGSWYLIMNHCEGTFTKKFRQDLGLLSWEDFKNFNTGYAPYADGWQVTKCDKKKMKDVKEWYSEILDYIRSELSLENKIDDSQITETNNTTKNSSSDEIEKKLIKLKKMFEDKLITEEEYDKKRKEILDEM